MAIDRPRLEAELRRLTLAVYDMNAAAALILRLQERGLGGDALENGLMTGMVVAYARPFSASNRIGRISTDFDSFEDSQKEAHHQQLLALRDKLYAHTDVTILRNVIVFPPGAWGERGSATATTPWSKEAFDKFGALIQLQTQRLRDRIADLVEELYGDQEWGEGHTFELRWPEQTRSPGADAE